MAGSVFLSAGLEVRYNVKVPMRDDVNLSADIFFKKGHRIRVDISSSNFPRFDRNPNTGDKFGQDAELRVAHQTVLHDRAHQSHVLLPVILKS